MTLRGYNPDRRADDAALDEVLALIEKAERPVMYAGGGIITGGAADELRQFRRGDADSGDDHAHGLRGVSGDDPLSLKWLGMHGTAYANWAVAEADLLLAFGVRFDDRVTGKVDKFCEHGTIVHIDIDASEINKNRKVHLPVISDIKYALARSQRPAGEASARGRRSPPGTGRWRSGRPRPLFTTRSPRKCSSRSMCAITWAATPARSFCPRKPLPFFTS